MPLGDSTYINHKAQKELTTKRDIRALGLGALATAAILRHPLAEAAEGILKTLSEAPAVQRTARMVAVKTFDALEKAATGLAHAPLSSRYFKPSSSPIIRRDLHAAQSFFKGDLSWALAYGEAGKLTGESLRLQPQGGWEEGKIEALLKDQSFFREAIQSHTDSLAKIQSRISEGRGGFYSFLSQGGPVSDATISQTARELADAIHGGSFSGQGFQKGIGWNGIWADATRSKNPLRQQVALKFAGPLKRESVDTPLETLFGVRQARTSKLESDSFASSFGLKKGSLTGLRSDWQNAAFTIGEKNYDLSGFVRVGQAAGRFLNERIAIPFAPLQTSVSSGQLFPFLKRSGDSVKLSVLDSDPLTGKFRINVRNRILGSEGKKGRGTWEKGRYDFLKGNKRHLRELIEARGSQGVATIKQFFKPSIAPGTVPYWDAPLAFLRKFTGHAPHYLPNLLNAAAEGTLTSSRDTLDVVNALRHGSRYLTDANVLQTAKAIHSLGVPGDLSALEARISSAGGWSSAHKELAQYVQGRAGGAPRLRKILEELIPLAGDERAIGLHLSGTASYRASRAPERLLGLHLGSTRRLTRLDVLKHDLVLDLIESAKAAGKSSDEIAFAMKNAGPEALAIVHAQGIESAVFKDGPSGLKEFVGSRPEVQTLLRETARKKRNFLDLAPRERATWEDFTSRQNLIAVKQRRSSYRTLRKRGKNVFESLVGDTSWGQKFYQNRKTKGLLESAYKATTSGAKDVGDSWFTSNNDSHKSLYGYWMVSRLHEAFSGLGWGLPKDWQTSPGKMLAGMLVGRLLPLTLLPEANKLINRITRTPGLRVLNPDLHRAHFLRLVGHASHKLVNHRHLTGLFPGLDFYTDDRSSKEQGVHERYADFTPVRKGRFWLFGSREMVMGSKVSYYLPSASRLAKSDWQGAKNVNQSSWQAMAHLGGYFNPMNWGEGAYYRENAMRKAGLGISMSGPAFDSGWVTSPLLNSLFGWMKPRRYYDPSTRPVHLGGTMTGLPRMGNSPGTVDPLALGQGNLVRGSGGKLLGPGGRPILRVPTHFHLTDPSKLGPEARRRAGLSTGTGVNSITPGDYQFISQISTENSLSRVGHQYQELSGLYGWMANILNPELSRPVGKVQIADASRGYGIESRFWDQELGGLGGGISDVLRRFFPHSRHSIHVWDETPNNLPDYLPEELRHGNPQARMPMGALRLPGDAYSRSHPYVKEGMLKMRASSLGKSPEEIREHFLHPEGDGRTSAAAEMGTKMHRVLQARWKSLGILEAEEVSVYNKEWQTSGHLDGILRMRMENGSLQRAIVDIKTKTAARYAEVVKTGKPEEENLEQIQFYMHTTGIHHALLTYVNRDDMSQVHEIAVDYDPHLIKQIKRKLDTVRQGLRADVKAGRLNEGQLYAPIDRYEILSDVGMYTDEFRHMAKWAADSYDGMSSDDKYRIDDAKKRMKRRQNGFELHDYRFRNLQLHGETVRISKILSNTSFEDDQGKTYSLAGIKASNEKSPYSDAKETWSKELGLREGSRVKVLTSPGDNQDSRKAAVISRGINIAKRLTRLGFTEEDGEDFSAPAIRNRFSQFERTIGGLFETVSHIDNPISTKLLPNRSGLEQYERTDVYGKSSGSWDNALRDYGKATLDSMMNKKPLTAALFGAFFGSLFSEHPVEKLAFSGIGAAVFTAASLLGRIGSSRSKPPIPKRVQERRNIEEYYDNLTYLKYKALAAKEATEAYEKEGINVEDLGAGRGAVSAETRHRLESLGAEKKALLEQSIQLREKKANTQERKAVQESLHALREEEKELRNQALPLGDHALRAILYRDRALSTLRGSLETGDTNAALRALPKESRHAIEDVVHNGTKAEKQRLYELLPQNQKVALGSALGQDPRRVPRGISLEEYFKKNPLPKDNWEGWDADLSLDLIEAKDIVTNHKHLDPMDFAIYPGRIEEATLMSPEASIASPQSRGSHHEVQARIESLLAGHGLHGRVKVEKLPPSREQSGHKAAVTINMKHRREHAALSY